MEPFICASLELLAALPSDDVSALSEDARVTLLHAALCPLAASVASLSLQPSLSAAVHTRARAAVPALLRALALGGGERASLALAGLALAAATSGAVADAAAVALREAIARVAAAHDDGAVGAVDAAGEAEFRLPGALSSALASALNALSGPSLSDDPSSLGLPCSEGAVRRSTLSFACALIAESPSVLFSSDAAVLKDISARARGDSAEPEFDELWSQLLAALG
jgi:hypothetical protein